MSDIFSGAISWADLCKLFTEKAAVVFLKTENLAEQKKYCDVLLLGLNLDMAGNIVDPSEFQQSLSTSKKSDERRMQRDNCYSIQRC